MKPTIDHTALPGGAHMLSRDELPEPRALTAREAHEEERRAMDCAGKAIPKQEEPSTIHEQETCAVPTVAPKQTPLALLSAALFTAFQHAVQLRYRAGLSPDDIQVARDLRQDAQAIADMLSAIIPPEEDPA